MKKQLFILLLLMFPASLLAQNLAVKNNLVYDAMLTPNLGLEIALNDFHTLDVSAGAFPFSLKNSKRFKHWLVQPEYRTWFCEKFNGGFWGVHLHGGEFSVAKLSLPFGAFPSLKNNRYEGWFIGAGASYGYHWMISKNWGFEAVIGAGYAYIDYDKYPCPDCGPKIKSDNKHYFGITKAALSFVYIIR